MDATVQQKLLDGPVLNNAGTCNRDEVINITAMTELRNNDGAVCKTQNRKSFHQAAKDGDLQEIKKYIREYEKNHAEKNRNNNVEDKEKNINTKEDGYTALHYAIQYGRVDVINELLDAKADVNAGLQYQTAIFYAVKYFEKLINKEEFKIENGFTKKCLKIKNKDKYNPKSPEMTLTGNNVFFKLVKCHMEANEKKNYFPTGGNLKNKSEYYSERNVLHYAFHHGKNEAAKILMSAGLSLLRWDGAGLNPLHVGLLENGKELVRETITDVKICGDIDKDVITLNKIVNDRTEEGVSLLHIAIEKGDFEMTKFLVDNQADVNLSLHNGDTPLHIAAKQGCLQIFKLLYDKADLSKTINEKGEKSLLHKAAGFNNYELVEFLLERKYGDEISGGNHCENVLMKIASQNSFKKIVNILLQHNKKSNAETTKRLKTAMLSAIQNGQLEMVEFLLDKSFNLLSTEQKVYKNGDSLLHIASEKGQRQIVEFLLDKGEDIEVLNDFEQNSLHLACTQGHVEIAALLLEKNDSIKDKKDYCGASPLLYATMSSSKCVSLLLKKGASVNTRCNYFHSPLHSAICYEQLEVVKILLDHNVDTTIRDKKKWNALNWAIYTLNKDIVFQLLYHDKGDREMMMRNHFEENGNVVSPMRQMIEYFPEAAHMVLNQCMEYDEKKERNEDLTVKLDFELINDACSLWNGDDDKKDKKEHKEQDSTIKQCLKHFFSSPSDTKNIATLLKRKEQHPLSIMCKHKRSELLKHPVVISLVYDKWVKFGRGVFYGRFLLYAVFIFFLTGFVAIIPELIPLKGNGTLHCNKTALSGERSSARVIFFFFIGKYMVIMLSCLQLFLELIQFASGGIKYMEDLTNWIETPLYILSVLFVSPSYDSVTTNCEREVSHISYGACAIFLAWTNLLLFIQKIPHIGIYVVLFIHVTKTFLKFFITFSLFIVAFGLAFYILLGQQDFGFHNSGYSFMKTNVMMTGEYDFGGIFDKTGIKPPPVTWLLFFLLIIMMTFLLMNVMIGLAVDDIKGVLEMAEWIRIEMLINFVLETENLLRLIFKRSYKDDNKKEIEPNKKKIEPNKKKIEPNKKKIEPNKTFTWFEMLRTPHIITMKDINRARKMKDEREQQFDEKFHSKEQEVGQANETGKEKPTNNLEELKNQMASVQQESQDMKKHVQNMENMMEKLLHHLKQD